MNASSDSIPWPGTALSATKHIKNNKFDRIMMIKCFDHYPTMEDSIAFMFDSSMESLNDFTLGNTVLHEVSSH